MNELDAESLRELSKMAMQDGDEWRCYQLAQAAEAVALGSPYAPVLLELIGEMDRLRVEAAKRDDVLRLVRGTIDYVKAYGEARGIEHLVFTKHLPAAVAAFDALKGEV